MRHARLCYHNFNPILHSNCMHAMHWQEEYYYYYTYDEKTTGELISCHFLQDIVSAIWMVVTLLKWPKIRFHSQQRRLRRPVHKIALLHEMPSHSIVYNRISVFCANDAIVSLTHISYYLFRCYDNLQLWKLELYTFVFFIQNKFQRVRLSINV